MKKLLSIILALFILFSLSCCTKEKENEDENKKEAVSILPTQAEEKITENWNSYLEINEKRFSAIGWAAQHLSDFCKNPDTSSLRRALASAEAVAATLSQAEAPELTLTDEDVNNAIASGADISFISLEFSSLESVLAEDFTLWQTLSRDIITEGFWSYGTEYLEKTADIQLKKAELNAEYLRLTTNYLLLLLGKDSFDGEAMKKYPAIFKEDADFIPSLPLAEKAVSDCLDSLEELIRSYSDILATQSANILILEDAVSTGDFSKVYGKALPFAKGGFAVPCPSFGVLPDVFSYHTDENGEAVWTSVGEDLSNVPNGLILQYSKIGKDEYKQYIEQLETSGFKGASLTGNYTDSEPCRFIFADGTNEFAVGWEDSTVTLYITQSTACVCPFWYIDYLAG